MTTYPKISIVTPNFNYGHFLEQTMLSVLDQQYPNLEYIIIDGGSTDNSVEIINKYRERLSYFVSEPDKGMYDAINKGFGRATGDIMAWLNSDDMYFPWALKVVAEIFTTFKEIKWISSLQPGAIDYNGYVIDFGRFDGFNREAFREGYNAGFKYSYGFIQQESTFWTKELWQKAGGYVSTTVSTAGDFELWCRFFNWEQLYGLVSPLGMFRLQHAQQSSVGGDYGTNCNKILASLNYKKSIGAVLRNKIKRTRLDRTPGIMHSLKKHLGYDAEVVVRANRNLPGSHWEIESRRFI